MSNEIELLKQQNKQLDEDFKTVECLYEEALERIKDLEYAIGAIIDVAKTVSEEDV